MLLQHACHSNQNHYAETLLFIHSLEEGCALFINVRRRMSKGRASLEVEDVRVAPEVCGDCAAAGGGDEYDVAAARVG